MSTTHDNQTADREPAPVPVAQRDWFSIACGLLAPGTKHYSTTTVALDWDSFDKLEVHGWEYQCWWVDPKQERVAPGRPDARLHEQRSRTLADGSTVTCQPPTLIERPDTMVCIGCLGRGWRLLTDEDGDPRQDDCRECDGSGRVPRPLSSPSWLHREDFAPPADGEPSW